MAAVAASPTSAPTKQMPAAPTETPAPIKKVKKSMADAKPKMTKTQLKASIMKSMDPSIHPQECFVVMKRLPPSLFEFYMKN